MDTRSVINCSSTFAKLLRYNIPLSRLASSRLTLLLSVITLLTSYSLFIYYLQLILSCLISSILYIAILCVDQCVVGNIYRKKWEIIDTLNVISRSILD